MAVRFSLTGLMLALLAVSAPAAAQAVSFSGPTSYEVGGAPYSVASGDFNGDSDPDLVVGNSGSPYLSVLLGTAGGGFAASTSVPVGHPSTAVAVGDFNGDSHLDLADANPDYGANEVSILLGDGSGGFGGPTNFPVGPDPRGIAVGDFNGDSHPDLAVANLSSYDVSILLGDGSGGFSGPTDFLGGGGATAISVGYFNSDSRPDLVVVGGTGSILLGNGSGGFSAPNDFSAGSGANGVAVEDFNLDSHADVAVANYGSDDVSILLGNGSGGVTGPTNFAIGSGTHPTSVAASDFDGDSRPDLAVVSWSAGTVSILIGNGSGGFAGPTSFPAGNQGMAVADFNGDALPDLAVGGYCCPGRAVVLLNTTIAYPHPQSAPSIDVSLVPEFKQCGVGGNPSNSVHAPPPLSGGTNPDASCNPPKPTSSVASVGTQSVGSAQLNVVAGDVAIDVRTTDVQTPAGAAYDPTPGAVGGDLVAVVRIRITDARNCSPSPCGGPYATMGTTSDLDFPSIPVDCEAGGPGAGSTCNASTTANTLVPGSIVSGRRSVLQAFRVRLLDSANNLFEQQGFFVP